MAIDSDTLQRAQKLRRDAVEDVVNDSFARVARIAYGVTGSNAGGNAIVSKIVRRGLVAMAKWRDEAEPQRWYLHHTILDSRNHRRAGDDSELLIEMSGDRSTAYRAFVGGLRALPQQQVEAILLHHGESFNPRYLAIAMDCSVKAAEQHLAAATATMQAIAGAEFDRLLASLRHAYLALTPTGKVQVPQVKQIVRRHVWPRRLWRLTKFLLSLALVAAVAWFCYKILPAIEY